MSTRILDGTAIAAEIKAELKSEVEALGYTPGLAVILIGEDPASAIYVRNKIKACEELGIRNVELRPDVTITTEELLGIISELNEDDSVDGILVQLPLPKHIDTKKVLDTISPEKDVDGFHPVNIGLLSTGQDCLTPCTPTGILEILKRSGIPTHGVDVVVVGRSNIVGRPTAMMFTAADATVTLCHIHTKNLAEHTRRAEILVVAIGNAGFITADMVKPGAVLIDVGINRVSDPAKFQKFFAGDAKREESFAKRCSVVMGDIAPQAFEISSAYTPVPGGVGALTIAMLMHNTVKAARLRRVVK